MKKITALFMLCLIATMLFCCDDDSKNELASNTWSLKPEGASSGTYRTKTITLSTQTYQIVEAISQDNAVSGTVGTSSTLRLFFKTIGPPPTGTYSITTIDKLSGTTNSVGVYLQTFDDPSTGQTNTGWYSQEDSGLTLSYTFADGKISARFNDVVVTQSGSGPQTGTISANISQ